MKKQDRNLGLAIIAVKRSDLSDSTRNQIQTAMLGNSNAVNRGDGVIVLGEQFGYAGGVGYGIISSTRNYRTVADGQYRLLDTDIAGSEKGSGILFNTAGEVIGICDQSELQRRKSCKCLCDFGYQRKRSNFWQMDREFRILAFTSCSDGEAV